MAISFSWRLLIAAGLVLVAQIPAWQVKRITSEGATRARKFDVAGLPMQLGGGAWTGVDTEIDERLVRAIGASSIANRSYDNGRGDQLSVHLAVFGTAEMSLPHPPPMCYRNAGWVMNESPLAKSADSPQFQEYIVERTGTRAVIVYWYQLGSNIARDRGELRQQLQNLRWKGEQWPPLVKVLIQAPIDSSDESARDSAEELAKLIFQWVGKNS